MSSGTDHLLGFLRDHDAPCPVCGYNLRNLTVPTCPECQHALELTVGVTGLRIGLFIATLAPFMFSGMAGLALGSLIVTAEAASGGAGAGPPPMLYLLTLIGLASGTVAVALLVFRRRFLAFAPGTQRIWAVLAWTGHLVPFLGLLGVVLATM